MDKLPLDVKFTEPEGFQPYSGDENPVLFRAIPARHISNIDWVIKKEHITGNVSYDPENHEFMTKLRVEKNTFRVANHIPTDIFGDESGDVLVLGWGQHVRCDSSHGQFAHPRSCSESRTAWHINPFPNDSGGHSRAI